MKSNNYTIYSSQSSGRNPFILLISITSDLWSFKELIWQTFIRDIKAEYRKSILGYLWIFIPIIATTSLWFFLNSQNIVNVGKTEIPYPLYVMVGTILWGVFTSSFLNSMSAFSSGSGIFTRLQVPAEIFIITGLSQIIFQFLIKTIFLIPFLIFFEIKYSNFMLLFPFCVLIIILFATSLGLLLVPVSSLYSDINRIFSLGLNFMMYLTPVVYPIGKEGFVGKLLQMNPITPLIIVSRDTITGLPFNETYILPLIIITLTSCILLVIGVLILRLVLPILVERMGM